MQWTHELTEARLTDYLEGLLQPEQQLRLTRTFRLARNARRWWPAFRIC